MNNNLMVSSGCRVGVQLLLLRQLRCRAAVQHEGGKCARAPLTALIAGRARVLSRQLLADCLKLEENCFMGRSSDISYYKQSQLSMSLPSHVSAARRGARPAQERSPERPPVARPGVERCAGPAAAQRSRRPSAAMSRRIRRTGCPLVRETASFALEGLIVKNVVASFIKVQSLSYKFGFQFQMK